MKRPDPHYPDPSAGRTKFYAFKWIGGGYNQVYARSKRDAIKVANEHFGGGTANLRVNESSVYKTEAISYYANMPAFD
jgi:hypothetical protein